MCADFVPFRRAANVFNLAAQLSADGPKAGQLDFNRFKQFAFDLHTLCHSFRDKKDASATKVVLIA